MAEGAIEGVIGGVTDTVKSKLKILLVSITKNEGKRIPDYKASTKMPAKTLERYFKILKNANLVEFRGDAPQTGGYYLTEELKRKVIKSTENT